MDVSEPVVVLEELVLALELDVLEELELADVLVVLDVLGLDTAAFGGVVVLPA